MSLREPQREAGAQLAPGASAPMHYGDPARELQAGLDSAALVDVSARGRLEIRGDDRLEYLHRITAQAFRDLSPRRGVRASLLERTGKIVEVFTAHAFPEHLLLLASPANRDRAAAWLRRFVFRSRVEVVDRTGGTGQLLLTGPRAGEVAGSLAPAAGELGPQEWTPIPDPTLGVLIRGASGGWSVVADAAAAGDLWRRILDLGRPQGLLPAGTLAWSALRILRGIPEGGAEIDDRSNPLELGLEDSIDLSKGCFTGQEVLAKMIAYSSVKRRLVGLDLPSGDLPAAGASVLASGERVGRLTSVAPVPGRETPVGLALVSRPGVRGGDRLQVEGAAGDAAVVDLPFPAVR